MARNEVTAAQQSFEIQQIETDNIIADADYKVSIINAEINSLTTQYMAETDKSKQVELFEKVSRLNADKKSELARKAQAEAELAKKQQILANTTSAYNDTVTKYINTADDNPIVADKLKKLGENATVEDKLAIADDFYNTSVENFNVDYGVDLSQEKDVDYAMKTASSVLTYQRDVDQKLLTQEYQRTIAALDEKRETRLAKAEKTMSEFSSWGDENML